ncbi:MAG: peptidoglycan editing factor PgeF, partial [Patescibacteria group bacterium]|nr:peptidoglycan editing factor PgeF [Patescibacteria group bacterium]
FFEKFSISSTQVVTARLAQKNSVAVVTQTDGGNYIQETDGLITNQKNVFLSITVADCLPIFIYDPVKEVMCLLHAGWKGLNAHIIANAISAMQKTYSSLPNDLVVGIGPGIDFCHFAVKEDVLSKFTMYNNVTRTEGDSIFLNLKQIAKQQLVQIGVSENRIEMSPLCTFCEKDMFFSYRRDHAVPLHAMVALIGLRS